MAKRYCDMLIKLSSFCTSVFLIYEMSENVLLILLMLILTNVNKQVCYNPIKKYSHIIIRHSKNERQAKIFMSVPCVINFMSRVYIKCMEIRYDIFTEDYLHINRLIFDKRY